jgi:hypothetical protein
MKDDKLSYSTIYDFAAEENGQINRDNLVNASIEIGIDSIFLAMYYRSALSSKSVQHIPPILNRIQTDIRRLISGIQLNPMEVDVLGKIHELCQTIVRSNDVVRVFHSADLIVALLSRGNKYNAIRIGKYAQFVLALARQIDYEESVLEIPHITLSHGIIPYRKDWHSHGVRFNLKRDQAIHSKYMIRLFEGVYFTSYTEDPSQKIIDLCAAINIGIVPDAKSGVGITAFPYEAYLSSASIKRLVDLGGISLYNKDTIINALAVNNPWLYKLCSILNSVSLEADYSDQIGGSEETPNKSSDESEPKPDEKPKEEDPKAVKLEADDPAGDISADDAGGSELDNLSADDDLSVDNDPSGDGSIADPEDGLDNPGERKKKMLGITLSLPKSETLDTFMYKLSVANYIDNVVKYNHDGIPVETLTALVRWKSMLLFLTDAEDTERFLKELKIKMK